MARISLQDRTTRSDLYKQLSGTEASKADGGDCSVVAVAVTCGVSYHEAFKALSVSGRIDGKGATTKTINAAVKCLGFRALEISPESVIAKYPQAHRILKSVTFHHPKRFNKVWASDPMLGCCIIHTDAHVAAVLNGEIQDWSAGRAMRVTEIYAIIKA